MEHTYKNPASNVSHIGRILSYYNGQKMKNLDYIVRTKLLKLKGLKYEKGVAKYDYVKEGRKTTLFFKPNSLLEGYLLENFVVDQYRWLNVKDKVVFDVGAAIGDTAICFAAKGAKRVYAYEMDDKYYREAKKNIELNKMQKIISVDKYMLGDGKGGSVKFSDLLDDVKSNDIVMKMDIEGGEYPCIFSTDRKTLRKISRMIIEYHRGYLDLEKYLKECGFHVKVGKPSRGALLDEKNVHRGNTYCGLLYVWR